MSHEQWMQQALDLAEKGRYTTLPNPMVGCVIVKAGRVLAQAYHHRAGELHAEALALNAAGEQAAGAILYVTLEPCCHQGKTPPCVNHIIRAKIHTVVCATLDPNPEVHGRGVAALKAAGIQVIVGVLEKAARRLNAIFFHAMTHKRPYVIAKWAMSLDGKMIAHTGDDRQITGKPAQQDVHFFRHAIDAILVGAGTVASDNPSLTVRYLPGEVSHPLRIILAGNTPLSPDAKVFSDARVHPTWLVSGQSTASRWKPIAAKGVRILSLPEDTAGRVDLQACMALFAKNTIRSLYVEGGANTQATFFDAGLVDEVHAYIAPKIIAGLNKKITLTTLERRAVGDDLFWSARVLPTEDA